MLKVEEGRNEAAFQEAWDEAVRELGLDPNEEEGSTLGLIFDRAAELMADWRIPLPKSVKMPKPSEKKAEDGGGNADPY